MLDGVTVPLTKFCIKAESKLSLHMFSICQHEGRRHSGSAWRVTRRKRNLFFGIYFLAYIVCFKKHFVSISIVTCWHLYSTHAFKRVRSLPKAALVLTLGIQTRHSVGIRLHVHLNILEPCYQCSISFNNAKITLSQEPIKWSLHLH